jgi:hypothetical protein
MRTEGKMKTRWLPVVLLAVAGGCATSHKASKTWQNPEFEPRPFKRMMVIGLDSDPGGRRRFEDICSQQMRMKGVDVVASHRLFPDLFALHDQDKVGGLMAKKGVEGAITVEVSQSREHDHKSWGAAWGVARFLDRDAGRAVAAAGLISFASSGNVGLNVELWDGAGMKQVWGAQVSSYKATDVQQFVTQFADFLLDELTKAGYVETKGDE